MARRLLYYVPTTPSVDIRNRVAARRFDPSTGRVDGEASTVLNLNEMIVPAMVTAAPLHTVPVVDANNIQQHSGGERQ